MSSKRFYPSPISVRCTAEELEQLKALADAYGITLSALFRQAALGAKEVKRKRKSRQPVKNKKELARLFALLGQSRMASNLNQLARSANSGSLVMTPDTEAQLVRACKDIRFMRITLMRALGILPEEDEEELDEDDGDMYDGEPP